MNPVEKILGGGKEYVERKQSELTKKSGEWKVKTDLKKKNLHENIEHNSDKLKKAVEKIHKKK